ncbi:MAG: FxsA family protein [Solirubrobacterales bacterium]|nr:FxsA family protein [Solirubrobacterales bacterium]
MPLLVLLFIIVPIVELAVIIQVGQWIGVWPTIGLLVLDSILGAALMRSQGRAVWRRFNETLAAGRPPAREVADGALVIFGGALLLTPGFTTDIAGMLLLLPPTRALVRRFLVKRVARGMTVRVVGGGLGGAAPRRRPGGGDYDVEGTASEIDPRRLP